MSTNNRSNVLGYFLNRETPYIVNAKGVYLYDDQGNRILDASGGAVVCSIGHGVEEIVEVAANQMKKAAFVFRRAFRTPELEMAATKVCETTNWDMDRIFFVSGGSEATETAVKLARKYHVENGNPSKFRVISRWQSYHGSTFGALSWTGFTSRRADFIPYLNDFVHLPPTYCYRCWWGQTPETCTQECAQALENEILCLGPETVAAYIAEPVSGHALAAACPPDEHFRRIREICDRYDVVMILDEVMCGVGRTGKWYAYQHHDSAPDIIALAKGLSGGYYPVGAAAVSDKIFDTIARGSGIFGSGHTYAGGPVAAAVPRVDQFDADRAGVNIVGAGPAGDAGVPGAPRLVDEAQDRPVLVDAVVGADLGGGIAEARQGGLGAIHVGVVQQQDVDRLSRRPGVVIGRGAVDQTHHGGARLQICLRWARIRS